jgi:hypothetical protein
MGMHSPRLAPRLELLRDRWGNLRNRERKFYFWDGWATVA